MSKKYAYEEVKHYIEVESGSGCKLISEEYINNSSKLQIKCVCGTNFEVGFNKFKTQNKRQCNDCSAKLKKRKLTTSYDDVLKYVNDNSDCKLSSIDYSNCKEKLEFECICGNKFSATFDDFKNHSKRQCNSCSNKNSSIKQRFSFDYVKNFIESNSGCKLLSDEYFNMDSKINLSCSCGDEFTTTFYQFKLSNKRQCNKCSRENSSIKQRNDISKIKVFIEQKYNIINLKWIDDPIVYKNNNTKLSLIDEYGYKYYVSLNNLIKLQEKQFKPNKFDTRNIYTINNIKTYLKINNIDYELLDDEYFGANKQLNWKCSEGHIYTATWDSFLQDRRCPECFGKNKLTYEYVERYIGDFNYKLLSKKYTNTSAKLKIKCDKGHIYYSCFNHFQNGKRCPKCAGNQKKTISEINNYMKPFGYKFVSNEYVNSHSKIKIQCDKNHIYFGTWTDFQSGKRCPICNESKGEREVRKLLEHHNLKFKFQHTFDDLLSLKYNCLKFDFVLFNNQNEIVFLIEYDGEFHFEKQYEGDSFETTQIHDKLKNQYCRNKGISLIRIPYWQFDRIEQIMNKWMNKYNLIENKENLKEVI